MKKLVVLVVVAGAMLSGAPAAGGAERVPVAELLADGAALEGEVTITGELVGDYGFRSDGWVWAQLNEDPYATSPILEGGRLHGGNVGVGVRMPRDLAEQLGPPGGYRRLGPLVELTGTWTHHDVSRGGESYLQVESMVIVNPGRDLHEDPVWWRIIAGTVLLASAAALRLTRTRDP